MHACWLFLAAHIVWVIRYFLMLFTGLVCWVFMYKLNRTLVIGRENIPNCKNRIIISNHLTLIDSWFITMALCWPQALLDPSLIPWHLPETKNFFQKWLLAIFVRLWKGIPLARSRPRDFIRKLPKLKGLLQKGSIMIFPEGTRSRKPKSGMLYDWKDGSAVLVYNCQSIVVPVAIRGAENILPIGSKWWQLKIGKKMIINIGQPIDLSQLYKMENKDQAIEAISQVMQARLQKLLTNTTILSEAKK